MVLAIKISLLIFKMINIIFFFTENLRVSEGYIEKYSGVEVSMFSNG